MTRALILCFLGLWSLPALRAIAQTPADAPPEESQETAQPEPQDARDRIFYSTEPEHIKPLAHKFVQNVIMDQKEMWTSPLRIRSFDDAIPWLLVGAGTTGLILTDRTTAHELPNTVDQVSISSDVSRVGAAYTILPITAGFYIGGVIAHNEKARETGVLGGEAILDSVIVSEVFKLTMRRERPLDGDGKGRFFQGGSSFPSGHSTVSWALASVVAHEYNSNIFYPIAAYSLASLVSFSRLSGQNHFPSDIFAGAALGWFTGRYVFKTHVDHSIHTRRFSKLSDLRPRVIPEFDSDRRGILLSWGQ